MIAMTRNGSTTGKPGLVKRAKVLNLNAIRDTVHTPRGCSSGSSGNDNSWGGCFKTSPFKEALACAGTFMARCRAT